MFRFRRISSSVSKRNFVKTETKLDILAGEPPIGGHKMRPIIVLFIALLLLLWLWV